MWVELTYLQKKMYRGTHTRTHVHPCTRRHTHHIRSSPHCLLLFCLVAYYSVALLYLTVPYSVRLVYTAVLEARRDVLVNGLAKAPLPSLLNIQIELRKCCNHPYLINGVEVLRAGISPNADPSIWGSSNEHNASGNSR